MKQVGADNKPARPVMLEHDQDVGTPWSRWSTVVAEGAEYHDAEKQKLEQASLHQRGVWD
ncbi:hypothetical protein [Bradyrhizobium sp. I1.7.5]|uniref:hypothetical protein n=1 Tax=Bradyrhizobium sp. I1.7.5 TaxID=3156363 RepID=UPI0033945338